MNRPTSKSAAPPVQEGICERLDRAIFAIIKSNHKPVSIFLVEADRQLLREHATRVHREATGSTAYCYPLSYEDIRIISAHLIGHYEIPVRQSSPPKLQSTVYGSNGVGVPLDPPWYADE